MTKLQVSKGHWSYVIEKDLEKGVTRVKAFGQLLFTVACSEISKKNIDAMVDGYFKTF